LLVALLTWWSAAAPVHARAEPPGTVLGAAPDDRGSQLRRPCLEAELGPDGHEAIRAPSSAPPRRVPPLSISASGVVEPPRAPSFAPSHRPCEAPSCRGPPC
jgi:hypothetical protein